MPLFVAFLCLVWGSTWYAIRICLEVQPPLCSAALRFLIAGLAMAAIAPLLRQREAVPPPPAWLWLLTGVTNFAGSYGILYVAQTVVPSGVAAVLWAIFPLLMAGSGVLVLGERITKRQFAGFLVSFAGIATVFGGSLGGIEPAQVGFAWLLLLSPIVSATGTTLVKKYGGGTSSVLLNRNAMLFGAVLLTIAAFVGEDPLAMPWTWRATLATLYLAVIGTSMTFGIYFWLLRTLPASRLALISYVTPVLAMLIGTAVGDGTVDTLAWIGTALVVFGVALVVKKVAR